MITVRQLGSDDRINADVFLEKSSETCMFMRSNIASAGLVYRGLRHQGDHFGAFKDNKLVGVIGHYWNGNVMIQANDGIKELADAIHKNSFASGREIKGLLGPHDQAKIIIETLELTNWPKQLDSKEHLLAINLSDLQIPDLLNDPDFFMREPTEQDRELMTQWRYEYELETGLSFESQETQRKVAQDVEEFMSNGRYWLFDYQDKTVALAGFNAVIEDTVQPGGIWVAPEHRDKGFAKAITASILKLARDRWQKKKSVIFTQNPAAKKAYAALGYKFFDHYALIMFSKPYLPSA